ncbi:MAG TPA: c-type cytochrome domain-containing protein, partial [Pirellula sp.]|nr:c-type cytochrome domain-containing protein [Pirellula sp.]
MTYRLRRIAQTAKLTVSVWLCFFSLSLPVHAHKAVDFVHEIVPILRKHCAECHAGDNRKGSFSINTRSEFLKGSENGPVLDIGKADTSRLVELVLSEAEGERMPPEGKRLE